MKSNSFAKQSILKTFEKSCTHLRFKTMKLNYQLTLFATLVAAAAATCDVELEADEFSVAGNPGDYHFHSNNGGIWERPRNHLEIGEYTYRGANLERCRGMAEFDVSAEPSVLSAKLYCRVYRRGGLFSDADRNNNFIANDFVVDVMTYEGNNQEDVSDFWIPTISRVGGFTTEGLNADDIVGPFVVTDDYNGLSGNSLGIRMSTGEGTQGGAITLEQCELCLKTNQAPTAVCADKEVDTNDACDDVAIEPSQLDGGSMDPEGDTLTFSARPESPYPLGITLVELTVSDSNGGTEMCTSMVTVKDAIAPVLAGVPADVTVNCDSVPDPATPTVSDNCDDSPIVSFEEIREDGNCPDNYVLTRTWTATDASDNTSSQSQVITVQDTSAPVLSGVPVDVTVECDSIPVPATPTASDNCDESPIVSFEEIREDGNCPDNYVLTRTWTATDACGNTSSQSQVITVQDLSAPVLSGVPADVTVECDSIPVPATPTASDNCDNSPIVSFEEIRDGGSCFGNYVMTRRWTATDACGNASSQSQNVQVVDTTAPTVSCPLEDIVPPDAPVSFTAVASDNCDGDPSVVISNYDCWKYTGNGKLIDLTKSCRVAIQGDTVTIMNSGGVDTFIGISIITTDACGNQGELEDECALQIQNPGQGNNRRLRGA